MRNVLIFILLLTLTSCEYFNTKKIDSETILKEELKTFNWNAIDIYPVFETCDAESSKELLKDCFETTLSNHISQALQQETIVVNEDLTDTIVLAFLISEKGLLHLQKISAKEKTKAAIPNIEAILTKSLDHLPALLPAVKRDQPVKSAFTLPIVIEVN
ncbi:hypothetical protein N7U66_14785 [Lacinutrix neustonica]|uniref:Uncharacterized protein n=1 Tax=Lacinutrix neustonica TaxID=2980107 RepID=A0A9E8MUS7_9FLAO|nr:hypothetical protein [Lacinutrix neustonica]WAC01330.1 hypothetical protein N7U66_14785 [Lacinutrix neustonica]